MREKIISRLPLRCYRDAEERILNKISPPTFMPKSDEERQRIIFLQKNACFMLRTHCFERVNEAWSR